MHDLPAIVDAILGDYALPAWCDHGLAHWARVLENGLRIADANGADREVVTLFALFHDARRVNEYRDDGHGRRGGDLARSLRGTLVRLDDTRFGLLHDACRLHTDGLTAGDPTLQACWDADRLDLGRVGITPDPRRLCTDAARALLGWAHERATAHHRPTRVLAAWGVTSPGAAARNEASSASAERVRRVVREEIAIVPYDPGWPEAFRREKEHLLACLPRDLVRRVEHFGSTAVPGLAAKPVVDMLVEVLDLQATRERIAPLLEAQGYDYFWRPTHGDDGPPFYAWFIRRDALTGARTHHIHMVEAGFAEHWDRLLFRDHLIAHPAVAAEYAALKAQLAAAYPRDRAAYTRGKSAFIQRVMAQAKRERDDGRSLPAQPGG